MKKKLIVAVGLCLLLAYTSTGFAAASLTRLGLHPFSQEITTEGDLRTMVKSNNAELQTGFAKAGYPDLFPAFMAQFPKANVDYIQVTPGERLDWMLFKKNGSGPVKVLNDVTWSGNAPFDAHRFFIDKNGQRYEFVVPAVCGNLSLRNVGLVPTRPAVVPKLAAVVPEPFYEEPVKVEERLGGPVVDVGLAHQFDPATYVFGRVGYEVFMAENLSAMGLVGGFVRVHGEDGGSAFTADALLNFYPIPQMFIGAGVGFWSGNDGNVDLIVNLGFQIYENPGVMKTSLFIEGRCKADELVSTDAARFGAGLRFQF